MITTTLNKNEEDVEKYKISDDQKAIINEQLIELVLNNAYYYLAFVMVEIKWYMLFADDVVLIGESPNMWMVDLKSEGKLLKVKD